MKKPPSTLIEETQERIIMHQEEYIKKLEEISAALLKSYTLLWDATRKESK
jgi:hypothetical protein